MLDAPGRAGSCSTCEASRGTGRRVAGPFGATIFTAVILGVVESAMEEASAQLRRRRDSLRPYEQVEWSNAEQDAWLMRQAYEGMLRAIETEPAPLRTVVLGKTAAAGLAEEFGYWFEDVRALGFLRPPWGLSYDALSASAWPEH